MIQKFIGLFFTLACVLSCSLSADETPQQRRFRIPIDKLKALLASSSNVDEVIENLRKSGRGPIFSVEGLARLYTDRYEELGEIHEKAKLLEDRLGWYIDTVEHIDFAEKLKWKTEDGRMPEGVRKELDFLRETKKRELLSVLEENGWIEFKRNSRTEIKTGLPPVLERFNKTLKDIDWEGPNKDRQTILAAINKQLKHGLQKAEFPMQELQDGKHAFRRQVRWLSIYLQSLEGAVQLTDEKVPGFESIKADKTLLESPYSKLPEIYAKYPILFPQTAYLLLTKAIADLGTAKDMGEAEQEWLLEAIQKAKYVEDGATPKAIAKRLVQSHPKYLPLSDTFRRYYRSIIESDFIPKVRAGIQEQRDWSKKECLRAFESLEL